ncbi:oligosaccharide flippase family protein [Vibrio sp. DNB22_12_1]
MNKTILSTLSYVFFNGLTQVFSLVFMLILMYDLDVANFSQYNVIVSLVAIFSFLIDGGLTGYIIKEYNGNQFKLSVYSEKKNTFINGVMSYQLYFIVALLSAYTIVAYFYSDEDNFFHFILFGCLTLVLGIFNPLFAILLAEQKRVYIILKDIITSIFRLLILCLAIFSLQTPELIYYIPASSLLISLLFFCYFKTKFKLHFLSNILFEYATVKNITLSVFPFLLLSFFNIVYNKIDVLMLEKMSSIEEVGFYAGATIFVYPFMFVCSAASSVILPMLTRVQSTASFENQEKVLIGLMSFIGVSLSMVLFIFSKFFYEYLFDGKYYHSLSVYEVLVWYLAVVFTYTVLSNSLIAVGKIRVLILLNAIMLMLNVMFNIHLIPIYGAYGAAWATLISEVIILLFMFYYKIKLNHA